MAHEIAAAERPINKLLTTIWALLWSLYLVLFSFPVFRIIELLCTTTKKLSMVTKGELEFVLTKDNASIALTITYCKCTIFITGVFI